VKNRRKSEPGRSLAYGRALAGDCEGKGKRCEEKETREKKRRD
jgi:hypothetical protein